MTEQSYSFDWDNIQILDTEPNYYKRSISEMLHKEQANGINAQTQNCQTNPTTTFLTFFPGFKSHFHFTHIYFLTSA